MEQKKRAAREVDGSEQMKWQMRMVNEGKIKIEVNLMSQKFSCFTKTR